MPNILASKLVLLSLAVLSFSSHAMECYLNNRSGPAQEILDFGTIRIRRDLPVGTRIWTSGPLTRTVVCWPGPSQSRGERVQIYPNPDGLRPIEIFSGIGYGIIYKGKDLGIISTASQDTDMIRFPLSLRPPEKGEISFQVYMQLGEKNVTSGTIVNRPIFTLDGVGGRNYAPGQNYRFILKGGVITSSCTAKIDLPSSLDFGSLASWSGSGNGSALATRSFSIGATRNGCFNIDKLLVEAIFDTLTNDTSLPERTQPPGSVSTMMDLGNGLAMTLQDSDGKSIFFNKRMLLANLDSNNSVTNKYTATLIAKGKAKPGVFNRPLILQINFI